MTIRSTGNESNKIYKRKLLRRKPVIKIRNKMKGYRLPLTHNTYKHLKLDIPTY